MILVGLDPGVQVGAALVEWPTGRQPWVVEARTFTLPHFYHDFSEWMRGRDPVVVIEGTQWFGNSPDRARSYADARYAEGFVESALIAQAMKLHKLTPQQWRKKIGVSARAKKPRVWAHLATFVLNFELAHNEHERDAAGIAVAGQSFV